MSQLRLHQDIAGYIFEGPYLDHQRIPEQDGLYAIISHDGKQYYLLDIGYAKNIKKACQVNPHKECWQQYKQGNIHYAFLRDPDIDTQSYRAIIADIRKKIPKIPCGAPTP